MINKRYKDIFEQYIHKGEPTPLTIGTLAVCVFCFLLLIVVTFTQITFSYPWFQYVEGQGFQYILKNVLYNPIIPVMIFIIYILGRSYSYLMFIIYLLIGFFVWPIFVFGGGLEYIQNYLFGYLSGFIFAIFFMTAILNINQKSIKIRLLSGIAGVISIHICGFIYCIILAMFGKIEFGLISQIVKVITFGKIIYDIIFSTLVLLIAPYIKNVFWICMKPKADTNRKKLKNSRKRYQVVSDNVD